MSAGVSGGRGLYGASLIVGIFALLDFLLIFLPKLTPLTKLFELIELYLEKINPTLAKLIGHNIMWQSSIGIGLVWLASFLAIESFTRKVDGLSVYQHISENSCGRLQTGTLQHRACSNTKTLWTFLTAPLLIMSALIRQKRFKTKHVSVGYVTINPNMAVSFIKHLCLGIVAVVTVLAWIAQIDLSKNH